MNRIIIPVQPVTIEELFGLRLTDIPTARAELGLPPDNGAESPIPGCDMEWADANQDIINPMPPAGGFPVVPAAVYLAYVEDQNETTVGRLLEAITIDTQIRRQLLLDIKAKRRAIAAADAELARLQAQLGEVSL